MQARPPALATTQPTADKLVRKPGAAAVNIDRHCQRSGPELQRPISTATASDLQASAPSSRVGWGEGASLPPHLALSRAKAGLVKEEERDKRKGLSALVLASGRKGLAERGDFCPSLFLGEGERGEASLAERSGLLLTLGREGAAGLLLTLGREGAAGLLCLLL